MQVCAAQSICTALSQDGNRDLPLAVYQVGLAGLSQTLEMIKKQNI